MDAPRETDTTEECARETGPRDTDPAPGPGVDPELFECEGCGCHAADDCNAGDDCDRCYDGPWLEIRLEDRDCYCESCVEQIIEDHSEEIAEYAAQVKITGELEVYEPMEHFAPTPEQYDMGCREAHTENSVRAFNRHHRTNYEELIRGLSKDDALDRAFYTAVRERVNELLGVDDESW